MGFDRMRAKMSARESMRGKKPSPLLVGLVFLLLTGAVSSVVSLFLGNPANEMTQLLAMGYEPGEVMEYVFSTAGAKSGIFLVGTLLLGIYSSIMDFGFVSYTLRLSRREEAGFGNLFDGFSKPLRVLWADFLSGLFTALWGMLGMVPGLVLLTISLVLAGDNGLNILHAVIVAYLVMSVGYAVMAVIAQLRYRLARYFILDDPTCTARQAIRRSKAAMKGWKMELFTLDLSFLGWVLLTALTAGILSIWTGPYMGATEAIFYDSVTGGGARSLQPMDPEGFQDITEDNDGPTPF